MNFCVVDIEMTEEKEIIQFSAKRLDSNLNELDECSYYIKPQGQLTNFVIDFTGITPQLLEDKRPFHKVAESIYNYLKDCILVCHGLQSDYAILSKHFEQAGFNYNPEFMLDTVELARIFYPMEKSYRLGDLAVSLNLYQGNDYHNADVDVKVTVNLLKMIREKIPTIKKENYEQIKKILKKENSSIYHFVTDSRSKKVLINKEDSFIQYKQINFKKLPSVSNDKISVGNILVSSIPIENYIENYKLVGDYSSLNSKGDYVPLDIFSLLGKENNSTLNLLKVKLYIWILETERGDFSELNLLAMENILLDNIREKICKSKEDYYYKNAKYTALSKENIVTNYSMLDEILSSREFKDRSLVFEDSSILGREINALNINYIPYKDVTQELNLAIKFTKGKKVENIKNNLDSLVVFLNEMYVSESLELYNESIKFIEQDIIVILDEIKGLKSKLPSTEKFLRNLIRALANEDDNYKFHNLEVATSLYLEVVDHKRAKATINDIHRRKIFYVKNFFSNTKYRSEKFGINKTIKASTLMKELPKIPSSKVLIIFQSNKYRDLNFQNREKKSYIKNINFTFSSSFKQLYYDLDKNNRQKYICYAAKDILYYKQYLTEIFDEIIMVVDEDN